MSKNTATAAAYANIAFIKYWGNRDEEFRIPANGSISMNLEGLETKTTVEFDSQLAGDTLQINQQPQSGGSLERVAQFLNRVRESAGISTFARVQSENNFPMGSGIASSASAFAALALAASTAAGLDLSEAQLSALARTGSGSASRSIPAGFVEWLPGEDHQSSFARSIAPPDHWSLVDCIAIVSKEHKKVGSTAGHPLANTSPLQAARVDSAPSRLDICRRAIMEKDFDTFAQVVELDSNIMHAVMMTSSPMLLYWQPATIAIMQAVQDWRTKGIPACYTIDAGPNVHVICEKPYSPQIAQELIKIPGVLDVRTASAGGSAHLVSS